eukprot:scaffold3656_cov254-Pinguiococcus_pyrenoidosus.AAC.13
MAVSPATEPMWTTLAELDFLRSGHSSLYLRHLEHALEVGAQQEVQIVVCVVHRRFANVGAHIVDQDVQAIAEVLRARFHQRRLPIGSGHICHNSLDLAKPHLLPLQQRFLQLLFAVEQQPKSIVASWIPPRDWGWPLSSAVSKTHLRPQVSTEQPRRLSSSTTASPIPSLPPVTIAVRPSSRQRFVSAEDPPALAHSSPGIRTTDRGNAPRIVHSFFELPKHGI